ncbi:MAG: hypothetical protein ACPGYY_03110 [Bacteroidia bacterium]
MNVKKIFSIFAIALFVAALFSSCRSRDACPGVGQVSSEQTTIIG